MRQSLNWERYGHDWPNREASRFVRASGMQWHVQVMGEGPPLLLLHGTGASTHSWAGLMPLLASDFTLVAPDLPGQGFTQAPPREFLSLPGMARAIAGLLRELDIRPDIAVGHSAGAAVAIQMTLSRLIAPRTIVSLNGALLPLGGMAGQFFAPLAKLLTVMPFVSELFSRRARDPQAIERMIEQTGSTLDRARHRVLPAAREQSGACGGRARHDGELGSARVRDCAAAAEGAAHAGRRLARPHHSAVAGRARA